MNIEAGTVEALDGLLQLIAYIDKWYEPSKHLQLLLDSEELADARRALERAELDGIFTGRVFYARQHLHDRTRELGIRERREPARPRGPRAAVGRPSLRAVK